MQWFRLYNDLRHDPKVQNLRPELFRFWVNLLCMASDQKVRGTVPSLDAVATDLGMRRDHVERFMTALEASNLVIRRSLGASNERLMGALDAFEIHGWSDRQPKSDDVAKRVKDHRDRRSGKAKAKESVDEKRYTGGRCNVLDSDTDTERDYLPQREGDEDSIPDPGLPSGIEAEPTPGPVPEVELRPVPDLADPAVGAVADEPSPTRQPEPALPSPGPSRPTLVDPHPSILSLPKQPDPAILAELEELSRLVLGDRGEWSHFYTHIRGWLISFPADWVRNVIYLLGANEDVKPNGMARYAFRCLTNWHPHGPRGDDADAVARGRRKAHAPAPACDEAVPTDEQYANTDFMYETMRRRGEERLARLQARRLAE